MKKPFKRYYDTNAVIYFFSRVYQQKYPDLFPSRGIDRENYICPLVLEETCHIFNKKVRGGENKQEDVYHFLKYLRNYTRAIQKYQESTQLFLSCYPSFLTKDLLKTHQQEKEKANVRDLFSYCVSLVHGFDLFITFDTDFKTIKDNRKLIAKSAKFPEIKILDKLP